MELPVKVQSCLKVDTTGFLVCSGRQYEKLIRPIKQAQGKKILQEIIDVLGALSAKSQGLKQIITSSSRFVGHDHRIYIKVKENKALGFLKVGEKKLFYRDYIGNIKQLAPTCILDVYVHQSCQRSGIGKEIFQKFLNTEKTIPSRLAIDRPSQKLLCFMKKHYGLAKYIPQNNNYVIYDKYFDKNVDFYSKKNFQENNKVQEKEKEVQNISARGNQMNKLTQTFTKLSVNDQKNKKQSKDYSFKLEPINQSNKHKNVTSKDFPLFGTTTSYENPIFRTTSGQYGNHYRKK